MTTAALSPSRTYIEDGVTLNFSVPFRYLTAADLQVDRISAAGVVTRLVLNVGYTATAGATDAGGTVALTASVAGSKLRIRRVTPRAQTTDYATNDTFPAESHEAALDRSMLIDQEQDVQIADTALRALLMPDGEQGFVLPRADQRKGLLVGFDAGSGLPTLMAGTGAVQAAGLVLLDDGTSLQSFANGFKRRRTLGEMGVVDGQDATAAITTLLTTIQDGDHIVFDRRVIYSAATGITITEKHNLTIEWAQGGHIECTALDNAASQFFLRFAATQLPDLTAAAEDLVAGRWFLNLTDASAVQANDLICIKTGVYFNGVAGTSGWDIINQQEWLRVRSETDNRLLFTNPITFDTPAASIVKVEHYRPCRGIQIINPQLTGPGRGGASISNGNGARAIMTRGVLDFKSEGGKIVGFPGYAYLITRFDSAWVDGLVIDSGEDERTTQAYYGVVHEGGRGAQVSNGIGRNIRRVADTGGYAPVASDSLLAIDVHHENIRGEMMNGSAAGTHHAYNYTFRNVQCFASPTAMTIRSRENQGSGLRGYALGGQLLIAGPGLEYDQATAGIDLCRITDMYCEGSADGANRGVHLNLFANGTYDLEGTLTGNDDGPGIYVRATHVEGFKLRGKVAGRPGLATHNVFFGRTTVGSERQKVLRNVDIQGVDFAFAANSDISLSGTSDAANPAENIVIADNTGRSSVGDQFQFNVTNPGFIKGETVRIVRNIGTGGSDTQPVAIGNPTYWSARPEEEGNRKVYTGPAAFRQKTRGDFAPVCVGRFASTAAIPAGTTVLDGDWIDIANPSAGDYRQFEAMFAGTIGAISGVTGTITAGSKALTLAGNGADKVMLGMLITVTGSGVGSYRVEDISADLATVTLDVAAVTGVAGAAVGYLNPGWKGRNQLQA